ncbi:MAG: hypothetical protein V4722_22440 [Bacteroidota bacterium]
MKKVGIVGIVLIVASNGYAQNAGIGTAAPLMKLHVAKADSAVGLLENTQLLNTNVKTALYFKTGSGPYPYTGAIKTTGEGTSAARLGLFSYASTSPNQLLERLSITDVGNVGIGTITPTAKLEVNGNVLVDGDATVNGTMKANGAVIMPLKVVTTNTYTVLPSDYTIVIDMQQDENKAMQLFLPTTTVVGRVLKIVAINMAEQFIDPNVTYPYKGTVSIYDNTQSLYWRLQALSFYFIDETRHTNSCSYKYGNFEKTTACSLQYAGATAGWVITDRWSEKSSGVYYIY